MGLLLEIRGFIFRYINHICQVIIYIISHNPQLKLFCKLVSWHGFKITKFQTLSLSTLKYYLESSIYFLFPSFQLKFKIRGLCTWPIPHQFCKGSIMLEVNSWLVHGNPRNNREAAYTETCLCICGRTFLRCLLTLPLLIIGAPFLIIAHLLWDNLLR